MNIRHYRRMLADDVRLRAFHRAIRATVRPGDVVVEIGAGLGTYSFFAAREPLITWFISSHRQSRHH